MTHDDLVLGSEPGDWVPDSCTLPTVERPLRVAEFDQLFSTALRGATRTSPTNLRLLLDADAGGAAQDLAHLEARCCTFFSFLFTPTGEGWTLDVGVPGAHIDVLDALAEHAAATAGLSSP